MSTREFLEFHCLNLDLVETSCAACVQLCQAAPEGEAHLRPEHEADVRKLMAMAGTLRSTMVSALTNGLIDENDTALVAAIIAPVYAEVTALMKKFHWTVRKSCPRVRRLDPIVRDGSLQVNLIQLNKIARHVIQGVPQRGRPAPRPACLHYVVTSLLGRAAHEEGGTR